MRCDTSNLKIRRSRLLDILCIVFAPTRGRSHRCYLLRLISISLFLADLIIMKFVLSILIDTIFFTFASSEFIKCSSDFKSLAEAKTLVSSAKILKHNFSEQFGKSFMYIKNKRGPNVLPCGMPHNIVCSGDLTSPNATYCFLFER